MAICDARGFANYIQSRYLKYNKGCSEISPIKLQKSLYFCFAYWGGFVRRGKRSENISEIDVSSFDEILFNNEIEAWTYGPVIPEVYKAYRDGTLKDYEKEDLFKSYEFTEQYIDGVLDDIFEISDFKLVEISHSDDSWKRNFDFKEFMHNNTISKEEIITEYACK